MYFFRKTAWPMKPVVVLHQHHPFNGDSNMHADHKNIHHDLSSSVPPVLDTHREWAPSPLEWQKSLPEVDADNPKPARPEDAGDDANTTTEAG